MGLYDDLKDTVEELFAPDDPSPKGDRKASTEVKHGGVDRNDPPKDEMQQYWRLFETEPLIREPITAFSREVVEPGWYVTAEDEETVEELTEWLRECAIIEGEKNKDFTLLCRKVIVQREVRGTTLIEKVRGRNSDQVVALYLHNPEEFEVYTHPRTNLLIEPDANLPPEVRDDVPKTEDDEFAAYVQYDTSLNRWRRRREEGHETDIPFTTDELIKFTRDADVGEVFGTSRIEAVAPRVEARQKKLQDNDAAIASKAYPFWLFKFGTEDDPWDFDEVEDFMEHHEMDNFKPSMKQGVSGDVDIDTISGDTADLEGALTEDVNHIVTGMPMPKFALGGYATDVAQPVASAQQQRLRRQIREARRELEAEFTPLLQEIAEERGLDNPDSVQLHIGDPNRPDFMPEDGQTIRYTSDSPQGGNASPESGFGSDGNNLPTGNPQQDGKRNPGPNQDGQDSGSGSDDAGSEQNEASIWDDEFLESHGMGEDNSTEFSCAGGGPESGSGDAEALADPRLINTDEYRGNLKELGTDAATDARDAVLDELERRFDGSGMSDDNIGNIIDSNIRAELGDARIVPNAMEEVEGVAQKTLNRLGSNNHKPQIDADYGLRHRRKAMTISQNYERSVEKAADDMAAQIETHVRQGIARGEEWEDVRERIENEFTDSTVEDRMRIISRMQVQNAIEATKLEEYERDDRIAGYKIINPCTHKTTRLCRDAAGCGSEEAAKIHFDDDQNASEQLMEQTSVAPFSGFDPMPATPPFHFGCRSSIAPLTE